MTNTRRARRPPAAMAADAPSRTALAALLEDGVASGRLVGAVGHVSRAKGPDITLCAGMADAQSPMRPDTLFRIASMSKPILAATALCLVAEGRIGLDDPVAPWLPELAAPRVLRHPDGPLTDTRPSPRDITLRDLLTLRFGQGAIMAPPGACPMQAALAAAGLAPGPGPVTLSPEAWMAALGALPLRHAPGEAWAYHTGFEVLAVLLARLAGAPLEEVLRRHVLDPLGMEDTGFHVPPGKIDRLCLAWAPGPDGRLDLQDAARGGAHAAPPAFPCELVSCVRDFDRFARMLLDGGAGPRGRVLPEAAVAAMLTDQITPQQKARSPFFPGFWEQGGWGFGIGVGRDGRLGWEGGYGTSFRIHPASGTVSILLTQRMMTSPQDVAAFDRFHDLALPPRA
ncbi:beta-lactamase family protein (plasmid) [Paroceanicella profunda]|uniref:Beta-lactamase family protein n=1 Tax=Paroceanicella profunda TaxID=2579971 RepID=A0A5B8G1R8_9RHOB|nr:serine hydrolase domain-containing protein [Paroceanicella profunda]QDL93830.1 beta-lactamase family protein [Paroceanicella profunda]